MKIVSKKETESNYFFLIYKLEDPTGKSKLFKEIEIMRLLDHPNALKVFEVYDDSDNYYIIEEYVSGGDVFKKMIAKQRFSEEEAACIMQQVFSCLAYCNRQGIMHRDIKPENIMLDIWQGNTIVKIIDWGSGTN